jgi:hypothetical protein
MILISTASSSGPTISLISAAVAGLAICFIKLSSRSPANRFGRRKVMLAERNHGARLQTLGALGVLGDKTDFIADCELVELAVGDAVAVEVDLVAVGAQDKAAILLGEEPHDPPVVGHRVPLDIPTSLADVIFEQPAGRIESIADSDVDILMRMVCRGIASDDDLAAGNFQVDADAEQITLLTPRVSALDDNTARHDAIEKPLELYGPLAYASRDRVRGIHVPKSDLKRKLHRLFPSG